MESWKQEMIENNYLTHHGILGQKWGVRRFQNYDGTYTQRGLKRYNQSKSEYDRQKARYESVKATGNKGKATNARLSLQKAERQLKKDYKQLKSDKRADKGKELYSKGYTITGQNKVKKLFRMGIGLSNTALLVGAAGKLKLGRGYLPGFINQKLEKYSNLLMISGAAGTAAGIASTAAIENRNNKIRAYYSHTSSKTKKE